MERERVGAWLDGYGRAWEQADPPAVLGLFTPDATYRAHPLGRAYTGHDAIADYWTRATAGQRDIQVRFGDPIVDGDRVAAEFWSTMRGDGGPVTVAGCLLLALAPDGRCRSLRECWHETGALLAPAPDWGRLGPPPGPDAGGSGADHGRRWAERYGRAWRAGDAEAAASLYAPDAHYRSAPFRDPHPGRDGVLAYTRDAYATETDQDPRFGTPFASGSGPAAAVE
jgi:ketosteroid isomerase-like protein